MIRLRIAAGILTCFVISGCGSGESQQQEVTKITHFSISPSQVTKPGILTVMIKANHSSDAEFMRNDIYVSDAPSFDSSNKVFIIRDDREIQGTSTDVTFIVDRNEEGKISGTTTTMADISGFDLSKPLYAFLEMCVVIPPWGESATVKCDTKMIQIRFDP